MVERSWADPHRIYGGADLLREHQKQLLSRIEILERELAESRQATANYAAIVDRLREDNERLARELVELGLRSEARP